MRSLTIRTIQGIGDLHWVYRKLAPHVDELHIRIGCLASTAIQQRAGDFAKLLPKVASCEFERMTPLHYERIASGRFDLRTVLERGLAGEVMDYACNAPLETGIRIEDIDPGMEVECFVPLPLESELCEPDESLCVYIAGNKSSVTWSAEQWADAIKLAWDREEFSRVVFVGASYDRQAQAEVRALLDLPTVDYCGELNLLQSLGMIRASKLFFAYQSGLSILAEQYGVRQVMLYFWWLRKLRGTWSDPTNSAHLEMLFSHRPSEVIAKLYDGIEPTAIRPRPPGHIVVETMHGLGDTLYQRGFISQLGECYVKTAWPQLLSDLPGVHFLPCKSSLRTPRKNLQAQRISYSEIPLGPQTLRRINYLNADCCRGSIVDAMRRLFRVEPKWSLPPTEAAEPIQDLPLAIIRPVTERGEWRCSSRNPHAWYVAQAARHLKERGYYVITVADLSEGEEWALDPIPDADWRLEHGELGALELLAVLRLAKVVISGPGWIVPAAVLAHTPLYLILGGMLICKRPEVLIDITMEPARVGIAKPDRPCYCDKLEHGCDKHISDFLPGFERWLDSEGL
jgi:hypothetical protein